MTSWFDAGGGGLMMENLVCGGVAGSVAKSVIAPFDRIKIHFQVANPRMNSYRGRVGGVFGALGEVYRNTGIRGMYRGHSVMLARIFPYSAINFMSYEYFKSKIYSFGDDGGMGWWVRLLPGSMAGIVAVTLTYPLDIIRTRLAYDLGTKIQDKKVYWISLRKVISNISLEGKNSVLKTSIGGFYQGIIPTILGIIPYAGVSFFTFETQKNVYRRFKDGKIDVPLKLAMGMIAGGVAQTFAYPLDVVRRRYQLLPIALHLKNENVPSILRMVKQIYRTNGLRGFFSGISINYLKVAPATGISFVVYEWMKEYLYKRKV